MQTKNIVENNLALVPSAVRIEYINITNHKGELREVKNICTKTEFNESIFTPFITLRLEFSDATNLLEAFQMIGQETIKIKLVRKEPDGTEDEQSIELDFVVTDYPTYGKGQSENLQVFAINAISTHAYKSTFKKISRSYSGTASDEIKKIFEDDLQLSSNFRTYGEDVSRHRGVINIQQPLDAAEYFRRIAYDGNNAPFYLYQLLNGDISFVSLASLFGDTNSVYRTYFDARSFSAKTPNDPSSSDRAPDQDYEQRKSRILEVSSSLNLAKLQQADKGAWASRNDFLDWSDKSSTRQEFNYESIGSRIESNKPLSSNFTVFGQPLNEIPEQHLEHIAVNGAAFKDQDNYGLMRKQNVAKRNSYEALMNTISHDVKLFGDFNLNPGRKIELKFPKAVDPQERASYGEDEKFDEHISGKYIITSAIHTIEGGEYYTNIRVKRDSFKMEV